MKALLIKGLEKTYANGVRALNGIDLAVDQGDFFAVLGPNGAGKTTAIGIVTSLVTPGAGQVTVFGHDLIQHKEQTKACIGLVPQEVNFNQFEPVLNIVINQAGYYGIPRADAKKRAEKYLTELQLWDRRHEISRNLSGGMKRRLMIARALMHEPRLLILDEPTAGVDIEIRRSMWRFLRRLNKQGTTIILTTHYLEEAENLCRNVAIIDKGQIIVNDRMSNVLRKLHVQTFVLTAVDSVNSELSLGGFVTRIADEHTIEVDMVEGQHLNELFAALDRQGVRVDSMRTKSNRLEELFIRLVDVRDEEEQDDV
ncbi:MAG: ABC transporter ATP-binding protein [Gammaproteobacteria bacterium]|nr:ABC transporter ATP-binding protein [Gammaproteobacteria bacterium]